MNNEWKKGTVCVQGGYDPKSGEPRILPIYQSTTYKYENPDEVAALFDLKEEGHMYSRISNPTVTAFEEKVSALEGGVGALAVASGQSATTLAILNICTYGQHIIAVSTLYGGTYTGQGFIAPTNIKLGFNFIWWNVYSFIYHFKKVWNRCDVYRSRFK